MSFDNTKYDIELNGVPHRIQGYVKQEAPSFIPRVAAGGQSETEFNSLLSKTLRSFAGGILQRKWTDDEALFATEGLYPIYEDGTLYPVNEPVAYSSLGTGGRPYYAAFAKSKDYMFVASYYTNGAATQGIKRIDSSGTVVSLTLPANLSSAADLLVSDMVIWRNELWISAIGSVTATGSMYRMPLDSTTVTEITSGDAATYFKKMVVYKDQLYGTNVIVSTNHALSRYTGTTSSKSYSVVGTTPAQYASIDARLFIFNNRIHLTRNDGLYAYDGVQFVTIDDHTQDVSESNFLHACVLKGFMYYFMPDGMYRYNGSMIEKLYDVSECRLPVDMCVGKNRLWLIYNNSAYSGSSRYDKSMGYDYSTGTNFDGRIGVYNGKAMYTYARTSVQIKGGSPLLPEEGENDKAAWFNDKLYVFAFASPTNSWSIDTNELALTGTKPWRMVTSIFDGDFPMVDKNLESVELVTDGTVVNESITVEYRIAGFDGSTGWTTLGTIQSVNELKRLVWKSIAAGLTFRNLQLRLSGTTTAGYGFSKLVQRYTLTPDFKWQWQFNILAYGDDPLAPLQLADGTDGAQTVRDLRGNVYSARSSDVPVKFVDLDQLDLNGAHNNSVTTINVNSTALLKGEDGFVKIDDEIMYWSAKTSTTLTVTRAVLGTSTASHSDNAKVFIVYRVQVSQIPRETITLSDSRRQALEDKDLPSEITVILREV